MGWKKRKKHRKPKFFRTYTFNKQDEFLLQKERILQKIHSKIAKQLFKINVENIKGDWSIKTGGITLFIDPILGSQAEITDTWDLPLSKRLKIHIQFLRLIRKGYGMLKAVEICTGTLKKQ